MPQIWVCHSLPTYMTSTRGTVGLMSIFACGGSFYSSLEFISISLGTENPSSTFIAKL